MLRVGTAFIEEQTKKGSVLRYSSPMLRAAGEGVMSGVLRLSFHGAAGTVTGSKHLVEAAGMKILLDAGMFQGLKRLRLKNWDAPSFDPKAIDAVLLSHAHVDHLGYLPRLVRLGLDAPVLSTPAAFDLSELMLLDAAKIQEEDARWANKKGFSKHRPALPLFDRKDARRALDLRRKQPYRRWLRFDPGGAFRARFHNAGHILGSSFIEMEVPQQGRKLRLVYSGDIGRYDGALHPDPRPLPPCDYLIMESTYGGRRHTKRSFPAQIEQPVRRCLRAGGTVLIPAFAVGRSQQVTLILRQAMSAGSIPEVPIHIDSPMATNATRIYSRYLNRRNLDPDVFEDGRLRIFPRNVVLHKTVASSKKLNALDGPRIIISSSGMLTAGRVLHHLARLAPDAKNLILMVGYQALGTRGGKLAGGAKSVKIHGRRVPVQAKTVVVHGLSGHADSDEMIRWVTSAPTPPRHVFLVHGEDDARAAFARKLERRLPSRIHSPRLGERIDLAALAVESESGSQ